MSVFIHILSKKNKKVPSIESFNNFLPLSSEDATQKTLTINENEIAYYWAWNDIFDQDPLLVNDEMLSLFGGVSFELGELDRNLNKEQDFLDLYSKVSAGCCYLKATMHDIYSFVSLAGTHSLFYLNNEDYFIVTTHVGLISSFNKLTLRKDAVKWLAGRYHLGDFNSLYNETEQIPVGTTIRFSKIENSISVIDPDLSYLFSEPTVSQLASEIENYIGKQEKIIKSFKVDFNMTLSGGKDSRAIVGLFEKCNVSSRIKKVTTNGYNCSPEVMSARQVLKKLRLIDKHNVEMPLSVSGNYNFPRRAVQTLFARQGEGSLVDLAITAKSKTNLLYVGGHENGLKLPANNLEFENYVDSRKWWLDGANIFKDEALNVHLNNHKANLWSVVKDAPRGSYEHLEALFFRNGTYVASALKSSNVGANQYHPFLNTDLIRIMLSENEETRAAQFILFKITEICRKGIESIGYCNDKWPEKLESVLKSNNLSTQSLENVENPYSFLPFLPDASGFGVYRWRQDMCRAFISYINEGVIINYTEYFGFIDLDKFHLLVKKNINRMTLMELGSLLGILTALIHIDFGDLIFDKSKHIILERRLKIKMEAEEIQGNAVVGFDEKELLKNKILELDIGLSDSIDQIRSLESNRNNLYSVLSKYNRIHKQSHYQDIHFFEASVFELSVDLIATSELLEKAIIIEFIDEGEILDGNNFPKRGNGHKFRYIPFTGNQEFTYKLNLIVSRAGTIRVKLSNWTFKKPFYMSNISIDYLNSIS